VKIKIYVEGGGNNNEDVRARCRQGFAEYCKKVAPDRQTKVVACGGRKQAFDRFKIEAGRNKTDEYCVLLVDSEGPVRRGATPATHLNERDRWDFAQLPSKHIFLMVEAMEAWFLADRDALESYYGQGFRRNALPGDELHIEAILKDDLVPSLENASRDTKTKGQYHKTRHGFALLAKIDPAKVEAGSPHAAAFHNSLRSI
jgi:hypothetical protein